MRGPTDTFVLGELASPVRGAEGIYIRFKGGIKISLEIIHDTFRLNRHVPYFPRFTTKNHLWDIRDTCNIF